MDRSFGGPPFSHLQYSSMPATSIVTLSVTTICHNVAVTPLNAAQGENITRKRELRTEK